MIIILNARSWAALTPATAVVAYLLAMLLGDALALAAQHVQPFRLLAAGLLSGLVLWIADSRIRAGSGYVYYDAELDQPVCEDEDTSPFLFVPMRAWAVILPLAGAAVAGVLELRG